MIDNTLSYKERSTIATTIDANVARGMHPWNAIRTVAENRRTTYATIKAIYDHIKLTNSIRNTGE